MHRYELKKEERQDFKSWQNTALDLTSILFIKLKLKCEH